MIRFHFSHANFLGHSLSNTRHRGHSHQARSNLGRSKIDLASLWENCYSQSFIRSISCRLVRSISCRSIYQFALKNCYSQSFIRLISDSLRSRFALRNCYSQLFIRLISDSLRSISDRSRFALRKLLFTVVYKMISDSLRSISDRSRLTLRKLLFAVEFIRSISDSLRSWSQFAFEHSYSDCFWLGSISDQSNSLSVNGSSSYHWFSVIYQTLPVSLSAHGI